ncbi:MAG: fumarylacetoacetate hydrolase family protein [Acidimicrobiales bacterium]
MDHAKAAEELLDMRRTGRVEPDLPADLRPVDLDAAYAIQALVVDGLLPEGAQAIGYKCACTSDIAQRALRIDRPVFGRLLSHTTSPSGVELPAERFTHRVIEAEFGILVGRDVTERDGGHTAESITDHVEAVIPAIEIVDYRYDDWSVGALRVAADNAIHGWWIEGRPVTDWHGIDLGEAEVTVRSNGEVVTTGSGANVLGHPLNVLAWLADELPRFSRQLRAGDLVTTGVATDVFEADRGDTVTAEFTGLGSVELTFT